MKIKRSIDVEDAVRELLKDHMTAYCRPLPSDFTVPSVLVTQIGGDDTDEIDTFEIMLAEVIHLCAMFLLLRQAPGELILSGLIWRCVLLIWLLLLTLKK